MNAGANTSNQLSKMSLGAMTSGPVVGRVCASGIVRRRIEGHLKMSVISSAVRGKKLPLLDERTFAEKFSPVVEDLNTHRVSRATGRSVETVKAWRARRAFPNGASLINAARAFPSVKVWLLQQIDAPTHGAPGDITEVMQSLHRLSVDGGHVGEVARAILQEMHKPRGSDD